MGTAGFVALIAVGLRFIGPKGLWLDEALTVSIARLPIPKLLEALRHDGSPPAYYVLLHYWMGLFGTATWTVRALAGVLSAATLPPAWRLGRILGGRRLGVALVIVLACNPFALRYATENRMYSLVVLLSTLAALTLVRCLQGPTLSRLIRFGIICGLLLLTHYWALYLIAAFGAVLLGASLRGPVRTSARLTLVALAGGCLMFVPWAPSFLFQAQHTGTPWSAPASPMMIVNALGQFAGWQDVAGLIVFGIYVGAFVVLGAALGLRGLASTHPGSEALAERIGWGRSLPAGRWVIPAAAVFLIAMLTAMAGGMIAGAAFAFRYASVVLPPVVVLVAIGIVALGRTRAGAATAAAALLGVAVFGTSAGASEILARRTQATQVATQLIADARPGDVVAYCPDQLGPAVSRLLPGGLYTQVTFPRFDDPSRINWVDYAQINAAANPALFARQLLNLAGSHQLWLVWEAGYRTLGQSCQRLRNTLRIARPDWREPVHSQPSTYYEHENLVRFLAD